MGKKHVDRRHDDVLIGLSIRGARLSAHVTQMRLAAAIGVTHQQIQNYEKGSARISASTLKAVAEFLNAPIASFFDMPEAPCDDGPGIDTSLEVVQVGN